MNKLLLILLMFNLVVLAGCSAARNSPLVSLDELGGPETEDEACQALVDRVVAEKLFPSIPKDCFFCELESKDGRTFQFALRFNQDRCGGNADSTLLDRFLVCQRSPVILWYDSSEDRYLPWEYTFSYRRR